MLLVASERKRLSTDPLGTIDYRRTSPVPQSRMLLRYSNNLAASGAGCTASLTATNKVRRAQSSLKSMAIRQVPSNSLGSACSGGIPRPASICRMGHAADLRTFIKRQQSTFAPVGGAQPWQSRLIFPAIRLSVLCRRLAQRLQGSLQVHRECISANSFLGQRRSIGQIGQGNFQHA